MATKRKQNSESEAIAVIDDALVHLPDDDSRNRVLSWAVSKYGGNMVPPRAPLPLPPGVSGSGSQGVDNVGLGPRARAWSKKHGITQQALEGAFHIDGDANTLIVKTVPGDSKKERVRSVAALLGAMALVRTDQAKFTAAEFREALKQYDAYDAANNPVTVKRHKDVIQGNASAGYTVTAVGLDVAAGLLMPSS
jgi:hypothetical protein